MSRLRVSVYAPVSADNFTNSVDWQDEYFIEPVSPEVQRLLDSMDIEILDVENAEVFH
jgi:hypothetical protein